MLLIHTSCKSVIDNLKLYEWKGKMPHIKQSAWNVIRSKIEGELRSIQMKKITNKNKINELVREQKRLKMEAHGYNQLLRQVPK